MKWTPDVITTSVDGIEIFSIDLSDGLKDEFHKPFNFVINVAAGGSYTGIYEKDEFTASLPAELVVDYVRIYDNGFTTVWTGEPTDFDTPTPTAATPTELPTSAPARESTKDSSSDTPTFMPTTLLQASTATMILSGLDPLDSSMVKKWQQVTENHLQVEIVQTLGTTLEDYCEVNVTLISQASRRVLGDNAFRSLQREMIELSFNSTISIQSDLREHDAKSLIRDSFKSAQQKAMYVDSLKESDAFFENAALESITTSQGVQAAQIDNTGPSIGFIAGMAAAGAAIFAVNIFFLMKWRQKKRTSQRPSQALAQQERAKSPIDHGPLPLEDDNSFYVVTGRDSSVRPSPCSDEEESEYASAPSSITIGSNFPSLFDFRSIHSDESFPNVQLLFMNATSVIPWWKHLPVRRPLSFATWVSPVPTK